MTIIATRIASEICAYYHATFEEVVSRSHASWVCRSRWAIAGILHDRLGLSYPEIARVMQRICHSTALAGARRYRLLDKDVRDAIENALPTLLEFERKCGRRVDRAGANSAGNTGGIQPAQPGSTAQLARPALERTAGDGKSEMRAASRRSLIWRSMGSMIPVLYGAAKRGRRRAKETTL